MKLHCIRGKMLCVLLVFFGLQVHAQVTIGSGANPNLGSLLDLKENDATGVNSKKGLLFSRVELEDINKLDPCVDTDEIQAGDEERHIGLLVYNVTNSPENGLCPGMYVWEGNIWTRIPEPCPKPVDPVDPQLLYTPNCYIVVPNGISADIPIAKAFLVSEHRSDLANLDRSHKVFVELLWQDTPDLIDKVEFVSGFTGIHSKIKVTTKSNSKKGNALIALRVGANGDENDPIAWSWHIWVTDYYPGEVNPANLGRTSVKGGYVYKHNNSVEDYVFMDRNLGAIGNAIADGDKAKGLMYQWGRKDPFTSDDYAPLYNSAGQDLVEDSNGLMNVSIPASTDYNLAAAIKFPMNIYTSSSAPRDWYTTDPAKQDDNLWGENTKKKSVFDPCPAGWRVPFDSADSGGWGGASPWGNWENYPLANPGHSGTGTAGEVGPDFGTHLGYYIYTDLREFWGGLSGASSQVALWSGSSKDISGGSGGSYTFYTYDSMTDNVGGPRARAMSVRCVREN